jgi:hypothetical protein
MFTTDNMTKHGTILLHFLPWNEIIFYVWCATPWDFIVTSHQPMHQHGLVIRITMSMNWVVLIVNLHYYYFEQSNFLWYSIRNYINIQLGFSQANYIYFLHYILTVYGYICFHLWYATRCPHFNLHYFRLLLYLYLWFYSIYIFQVNMANFPLHSMLLTYVSWKNIYKTLGILCRGNTE